MARTNSRGLELSWHKATNRWYKWVGGKARYYGSGKGVSDRDSYKAAVARYRSEKDETAKRAMQPQREHFKSNAEYLAAMYEQAAAALRAEYAARTKMAKEHQTLVTALDEPSIADMVRAAVDGPKRQRKRISELVADYLASVEQRHRLTEQDPESLGKKERVSRRHLANIKSDISNFVTFCDEVAKRVVWGDERQTESLLAGYREWLLKQRTSGVYSAATFNNKLQNLRPFVSWCYEGRHIEAMPRNLNSIMSKFTVQANPKPLSVEEVRKVWKAADGRMKCFIALGLNCAMYGAEIGTLSPEDIYTNGSTFIAKQRGKTGAPYKIKLWAVTQKLIKAERNDPNPKGLLFITSDGAAVGEHDWVGKAFTELRDSLGMTITFSQLRDTMATFVERVAERTGNALITSQVLAHSDQRTAKHYVGKSPRAIDSTALDAAIDEAEMHFGLKA